MISIILNGSTGLDGMGFSSRHNDHLSGGKSQGFARNGYFGFTVKDIGQGIEGGGVFAEFLPGVKSE